MSKFYKPFVECVFDGVPVIVYPEMGSGDLAAAHTPATNEGLREYLDSLYEIQSDLLVQGDYHIAFLWELGGVAMADIWLHDVENGTVSGPTITAHTFSGYGVCASEGIASTTTLSVLGHEADLFMNVKDLRKYIKARESLSHLPADVVSSVSFGEYSCDYSHSDMIDLS